MEPLMFIERVATSLNMTGTNPLNQKWHSKVLFIVFELLLVYYAIDLTLSCVYGSDSMRVMQNLAIIPAIYQIILKNGVLSAKSIPLYTLLKNMQHFRINKQNTEITAEVKSLLSFLSRTSKIIAIFMLFFGLFVVVQSFTSNTRYIIESYYMKALESPGYEIAFALQMISLVACGTAVSSFDILFVAFTVTIACELNILKRNFSSIKIGGENFGENCPASSSDYQKLSKLVKRHDFVLKCIRNLNDIYSFHLLSVFFLNMICICAGLLGLVVSRFTHTVALFSGPYALMYTAQLLFYCTGGSYLMAESEGISEAVYDCDWWDKSEPKFKKACVFIIQRSNKTEKLKAGGVFDLDLRTFTNIMRITYSFFTLVQAYYNETYT